MGKCPDCPPKGAPAYMMTFGDLMSLLLTFFVMLISMANFEPVKFKMASESLQGALGVMQSFPTVPIHPIIQMPVKKNKEKKKKMAMEDAKKVKETVDSKNMSESVKIEMTEKGIAILLQDPSNFKSGSADLGEKGKEIIEDISTIIKSRGDLKIRVEGHTDDVPIKSARYNSNWELSSSRALSIVEELSAKTGIMPQNMSAVGFGEHRPLVPNINEENRAQNRRIQIFVDYVDK